MSFRNDDQLIEDYGKRGDGAAFDILYQRYRTQLFGFIRQQVPEQVANEVFQQCWEAVIRQAADYLPGGSFRSYLFTICRRRLADHWRNQEILGKNFEESPVYELATDLDSPELKHHDASVEAIILHCVKKLPARQQEAFRLKQTGLAVDEISQLLQSSFETIKSRLRASYENLRSCWERHNG